MSSVLPTTVSSKTVNLPIVGSVSLITLGGFAVVAYFLFLRKKGKVSKKTTIVNYRS